jgi:hypothetical protein
MTIILKRNPEVRFVFNNLLKGYDISMMKEGDKFKR